MLAMRQGETSAGVKRGMGLRNSRESWGWLAIALHWAMAALILAAWPIGFAMTRWFEDDLAQKFELYQLHKSLGFTILTLALLRLLWRLVNTAPELPETLAGWEKRLAHATHWGLYALFIVLPLTGWLMVSSSPIQVPTVVFGLVPVPNLTGPDEALFQVTQTTHQWLAWCFGVLLVLHIAAALKHHLILKDQVLRRMLPLRLSYKRQ